MSVSPKSFKVDTLSSHLYTISVQHQASVSPVLHKCELEEGVCEGNLCLDLPHATAGFLRTAQCSQDSGEKSAHSPLTCVSLKHPACLCHHAGPRLSI